MKVDRRVQLSGAALVDHVRFSAPCTRAVGEHAADFPFFPRHLSFGGAHVRPRPQRALPSGFRFVVFGPRRESIRT